MIHNNNVYYLDDDDDDDYPYCSECYHKITNRAIKNYSYKPETIFYGEGNLFYGIELEIDKGGEYDENAQKIIDIANKDAERIYCKHDGSIDSGFEIVSPCSNGRVSFNYIPLERYTFKSNRAWLPLT